MPTRATSRAAGGPRWRRRKEARPNELVEAALHCFLEHGFAATRLEDVAKRAGVSKATVFLYFDGKEALFRAVVSGTLAPIVAEQERMVAAWNGSSTDLMRTLLRELWQRRADPLDRLPKLIVAEVGNFPELARFYADEVVARCRRMLTSVYARGVARGEFRPLPNADAARLAVVPLFFAAIWRHSLQPYDRGSDLDALFATHLDVYLRGIAAGTGTP